MMPKNNNASSRKRNLVTGPSLFGLRLLVNKILRQPVKSVPSSSFALSQQRMIR